VLNQNQNRNTPQQSTGIEGRKSIKDSGFLKKSEGAKWLNGEAGPAGATRQFEPWALAKKTPKN
jgi:hypothetical protein